MEYAGTGWEGTTWKHRTQLGAGLGRRVREDARGLDRRALALAFVVLFPLVAVLSVPVAAFPVAAGSCSVQAVAPSQAVSVGEPRARASAHCYGPYNHRHWVWAELWKDTLGPGNKYVSGNGKWSNNEIIVVRTSGWDGPGHYYTRAGVRWQDFDVSRNVYWG